MSEKTPRAIHEDILDFGGIKVRTYVLDNGQRIFNAEDFENFINQLGHGDVTISNEECEALAKFVHGAKS